MITIRCSNERGGGNHGWLKTRHTFSFSDYWDDKWMGFRSLRVINEDFVAPNSGFPAHPHRDMEIITYILSGELEHVVNGKSQILRPGMVGYVKPPDKIRHKTGPAGAKVIVMWVPGAEAGKIIARWTKEP